MLAVRDLSVAFGGVRALEAFDLDIAASTVHGLIGPNGAGKSTAIHAMTGVRRPDRGTVHLDDQNLLDLPTNGIIAAGLTRTFQQAQLWSGMSVLQNLMVPMLSTGRLEAEARAKEVAVLLGFPAILSYQAADLPFGLRRLVEVGRAIMTHPKLVLLDEPGAGLTMNEKAKLIQVLEGLSAVGTAVLLVDHDMDLVMKACERVTVLDAGEVIAVGSPEDVRNDPNVLSVYLGGSE